MASNKTNENKTKRKTTKKVTTKNNVTRKTTAKNHTSGTRKNASQKAEGIPMSSEITLVVAFGLVVLMMFSNLDIVDWSESGWPASFLVFLAVPSLLCRYFSSLV